MAVHQAAIIGLGAIGAGAHAPNYAKNERVQVRYLCDLDPEKSKWAKEHFELKDAEILTDYTELLGRTDYDVVSVCLPNYLHAPISVDFLNAGKDVLCEKPISVSMEKALEMKEAADRNGRILNIGVVNRFNGYVDELRKIVESGELGEVYHIYCSFRDCRRIPGMGGWFTEKKYSGGGVLIDWGVHYIDLILYILGNPDICTVSGKAFCKLGSPMKGYVFENMWAGPPNYDGVYDVDDSVTGFVRTSGPSISLNGAWAQNIGESECFIDFLGTKGGARLQYGKEFTLTQTADGKVVHHTPEISAPDMFYAEIDAFLDSVETREKNRANIDRVLITQKILNGIYDSSTKNREIVFPS